MSNQRQSRKAESSFKRGDINDQEILSTLVHKLGHEIGNPLTSIISLATILERFSDDPSAHLDSAKTTKYARSIVKEAWRVSSLTEKLVLLLSTRAGNITATELLPLVHSALAKLRSRRGLDSAWVHVSVTADGPISALCDADQMLILISECLENAYQASGADDPSIEAPLDPPISLRLYEDGAQSILEVATKQMHSCPFELPELFQPFITSWADRKHIGLGLSVVAGIVERCEGTLSILESPSLDQGYEFITRIALPKEKIFAPQSLPSGSFDASERLSLPADTHILVIDDEPTVASAIAKILSLAAQNEQGVSIECVSGEEAIQRIENGTCISLILCDLNLAGMSGRHVFEEVQRKRPELVTHFAFITGDTGRKESELYLRSAGRPYLKKPFEPADLIELVKNLCSSSTR